MIANAESHQPSGKRFDRAFLVLIAWTFAFEGTLRAQEAKPAQLTLGQIYEGASSSRKLLEALRVEYIYTTRAVGGNMPKESRVAIGKWRKTFAYKGERRYSAETTVGTRQAPSAPVPRRTYVFDGKSTFAYRPGSLMIFEGKADNTDQSDTYCEEVLDVPVSDAGRANHDNSWFYPHCLRPRNPAPDFKDYVVLAGQEKIDGAWCHVVNCAGKQKLWVDPQIGYALRRKEMYRPGGRSLAEYSYTEFIEPVKGLWLPTRCTRLTSPFDDDKVKLQLVVEVKDLLLNDRVADGNFDLAVDPGTIVTGPGKGFVVQGDKTRLLDLVAGDLAPPRKDASFLWARWVTISLSLAVVLAAAVYWRSRSDGRKSSEGRVARAS